MPDENWKRLALCKGLNPENFMPYDNPELQARDAGEFIRRARKRAEFARSYCDRCPVRQPCREIARTETAMNYAPATDKAIVGIFGGETYAQRRKALRANRDARLAEESNDLYAEAE